MAANAAAPAGIEQTTTTELEVLDEEAEVAQPKEAIGPPPAKSVNRMLAETEPRVLNKVSLLIVHAPQDEVMAAQLIGVIQPWLSLPVRIVDQAAKVEMEIGHNSLTAAGIVAAVLVSAALSENEALVEAVAHKFPNALLPVLIDKSMSLQKSWRGAMSWHMANELYFDFSDPNLAEVPSLLRQIQAKARGEQLEKVFDVFMSHEWGVHSIAENLAEKLEKKHSLTVWIDEREMNGSIDESMSRGIEGSKVFLVLATEKYMKKVNSGDRRDNCLKEFRHASNQRAEFTVVAALETDMIKASSKWTGSFQLALTRQTPIDITALSDASLPLESPLIDEAVERLAKAIAMRSKTPEASSDLTPIMRDMYPLLNPCSSKVWAKGKAEKFTAGTRRWILDEICDWYNGAKSAVFLLVGDGGVGKSVIMAELCRHGGALTTINDKFDKGIEKVQNGIAEQGQISLWKERLQVAAYHFFRHDQVNMAAAPKEALVSIAWQLCQSVPGFADELDGVNLEGLREKTLADVFQAILVDPAGKLSLSQRRQLVVLDALDECKDSDEFLRKVIRVWKDDMPTWLSLVVSTRPEGEIQRGIKNNSLDSKVLELKDDKNFGDIKFHIEQLLANMSDVVEQEDVVSCAEILSKRSEGLFLWASFLPETLRRAHEEKKNGLLTMQDISKKDAIPNGLGGMFEEYFERLRDKMGGDKAYQTLLTPIVAAREPLSEGQLSAILGQNKKRTKKIIGDARNLLYQGGDGRVALLHKRMADWLLDDDVSGDLGVDIDEGHERLAAYCSSSRDNIFSLRHAVFHSVKSGDSAKAFELLNDFAWVKKAISVGDDEAQRRGTIGDLIRDCVDLGINFAPQSDTPRFLSKAVHALSYDPNELASQVLARLGHAAKNPLVLGLQPPDGCPWLEPVRVTLPHPRDPLLHVLQGHSYSVNCVAIQDDIIVSGSADNTMRIWSATSGEAQHVLSGHSSRVRTVAMQGDIIVSGSRDKTVRVWSVTSGAARHILEGHADQVTSVTIQGDIIVSASSDETVRTWHATSGEALHVLKGHSGTVWSVTMQGDTIVSGSADKTLRTWNVTTGEEQLTIEGHTGWVRSVAIQGNIIVSGSADLTVRTWNAISGEAQHVLTGHSDWVRTVAIQGDIIVSGSRDKTLRVWSTVSGEVQHVLKGHSNWIRSVVMQGDIIVSASRDKTVRIWSVTSGEAQHVLSGHADQVMSVAIHGDIVVSASSDRTVRTWKATSGELEHVLEGHSGTVMSVAIEGDTLVSGSADKTARVWNATSGELQHILEGHSGWVMSVAIHGDAIVSGSADNTVCIWNALSGEAQHVLKGHSSRVRSVAIQGDVIVSQSVDSTRYWSLQSGEEIDANVAPAIDASESLVDVQDGTHVKLNGGVGFTIDHTLSATARRLGKVFVVGDRGGMVHILHAQGVKSAMTQA